MPFIVVKDEAACSVSRPWAVYTETGHGTGKKQGRPHGCHPNRKAALRQAAAMYVNVPDANASGAPPEVAMHEDNEPVEGRAKYDADARRKMAASGKAMPGGRYPIADVEDLRNAIQAVGRGSGSHDAIRKHVIKRARALGHADLVPDNWNADGSLADRSGEWETDEERATYNDLCTALRDALVEQVDCYCWLQDFDATSVYYQGDRCIYAAPYTVADDGPVTIGEGRRVRPITTYVPATDDDGDEPRSGDEPDEKRSSAPRATEWRRERASALTQTQRKRPDARTCTSPLELRGEDGGPRVLRSYASLFDTSYTIGGGAYRYQETVDKGAFKRSLGSGPDVVFRTEHAGPPLGTTWNDTLRLGEDERGLWYEVDLNPRDPDALSLVAKVERGDYRESSFAFRCIDDDWNDDFSERTLKACELDRGDVSVVTFGASRGTGKFMTLRFEESLKAIRSIGYEAFIDAWVEWRNFTLLPPEQREGKVLSSSSMAVLSHILDLVAEADEAVDVAQPLLADLLGVPNPDDDEDEGMEEEAERSEAEKPDARAEIALPPARYSEFESEIRALEVRR